MLGNSLDCLTCDGLGPGTYTTYAAAQQCDVERVDLLCTSGGCIASHAIVWLCGGDALLVKDREGAMHSDPVCQAVLTLAEQSSAQVH